MHRIAILLVVILPMITGCATTQLAAPVLAPTGSEDTRTARQRQRDDQALPPSRFPQVSERLRIVSDIDTRVNRSAVGVCQRIYKPETCAPVLARRTLVVIPEDNGINASVGGNYDITVLGGLVAVAGTDDEIAPVLAHEYAHAMLGHVSKSITNTMLGSLAGIGAGLAVALAIGSDVQSTTEIVADSATVGEAMGARAFSPSMELEADHLAMFIVNEAGYDIMQYVNFFRRMGRLQHQREANGQKGLLGFLSTHPSDAQRIQRLIATEHMIEQGATHPLWKQEQGQEQLDERPSFAELTAAADGDAQAQFNLGVRYANGRGVPRNDAEAVAWYRKAAEQGNADAQNNLGWMYANGPRILCLYRCGVARDDGEAVAWYRKAAEQGSAIAQNNLGWMYANGRGVPQDDAEAVAWYRKAAEQGNAQAQTNLGWMYDQGRGGRQD